MYLQLKFHDDAPYMLLTQSSFDELSRRLVERDITEPVTLEHFRPTITISGNTSPFEEVSFVTFVWSVTVRVSYADVTSNIIVGLVHFDKHTSSSVNRKTSFMP